MDAKPLTWLEERIEKRKAQKERNRVKVRDWHKDKAREIREKRETGLKRAILPLQPVRPDWSGARTAWMEPFDEAEFDEIEAAQVIANACEMGAVALVDHEYGVRRLVAAHVSDARRDGMSVLMVAGTAMRDVLFQDALESEMLNLVEENEALRVQVKKLKELIQVNI